MEEDTGGMLALQRCLETIGEPRNYGDYSPFNTTFPSCQPPPTNFLLVASKTLSGIKEHTVVLSFFFFTFSFTSLRGLQFCFDMKYCSVCKPKKRERKEAAVFFSSGKKTNNVHVFRWERGISLRLIRNVEK